MALNVSESQKRKLLAAVKTTTERAAASRAKADADSASRRAAVEAAMDAGIPRAEIAEAAGVHRVGLYQIIKRDA